MLDDQKKRLSSLEQFRILKVRSSAVCSHFGLKIFSKTLTESITLMQKWAKKNTKNRVIESETRSGKCVVLLSTPNDRSDYSGTTELYRTVSLTVSDSIAIFCDFLIFFFNRTKKIRVGTKIVGRVGLPESHNFLFWPDFRSVA